MRATGVATPSSAPAVAPGSSILVGTIARLGAAQSWRRRMPWLLVAGACGFGLVLLFPEVTVAQPLNDDALHYEMVRWAAQQIREGHLLPLDGWFPYLNLGLPQFSHYQSLPHLLTAYASLLFGADTAERWAGYLLLALFPLSVYWGARLLGWSRWTGAAAALVTPLLVSSIGYGYEHNSYVWLGHGLWSQEWGMFMLPIAWGLSWRAINGSARWFRYVAAAAALALTVALHFMTGYLALLSLGVFVVVVRRDLLRRVGRGVLVFAGAALIASWVIVPLVSNAGFAANSEFDQHTFWYDSYGAPQVLTWLFTGQIFDAGRVPVVSPFALLGVIVCAVRFRRDSRARALLGLLVLSTLLFFGRPALGFIIDRLPGTGDMQLFRYIIGVHLAGALLAGVGLAWLGRIVLRMGRACLAPFRDVRRVPVITAGLMAAAVLVTLPAWIDRTTYDQADASWIATQASADHTDGADLDVLIADIESLGGGRTYAGLPTNWGQTYTIGSVPVYTYLADRDVDEVGNLLRVFSLTEDNEAYFDQQDPAQYQLYGIRYLLLPAGLQPPVPATLIASSGRHRLYQLASNGYVQLAQTSGTITADRFDMAAQMQPYLHTTAFHAGLLPVVAFPGTNPPAPLLAAGASAPRALGSTDSVLIEPQDGYFAANVNATRYAAVVLKATFDPGWHVIVDGVPAQPYMVVPGFVAVTVAPGSHTVVFQYASRAAYPLLASVGLLTVVALILGPWLWRRVSGGRPR